MKKCTPGNGYQRRNWARGLVFRARRDGGRSVGRKGWEGVSPPVLRVSAGEGDAVHWIMAAKEEPVKQRRGESHPEIGVPRAYVWGFPRSSVCTLTSFGCLSG